MAWSCYEERRFGSNYENEHQRKIKKRKIKEVVEL